MINKETLIEIVVSNERFILEKVKEIVHREGVFLPELLDKVVVFYGVRRSGKTFLLFNFMREHPQNSLYLDFEDERLLGFQLKDFEVLREAFLELKPHLIGKPQVYFLDEVQNVSGWERFCRRAVERERTAIYVSGSSSRVMPAEIHTELRGRSWSIEVLPFSFREYLTSKGVDFSDRRIAYGQTKTRIKEHFSEFMRWGGFPEVSLVSTELEKTKLLKEYFGAMFFRDLVERYRITNIPLLESLTDKLLSSFSTRFSLTSFYKQYKDKFPFSKDLLFRYYKHFLQSMLVFEVRMFAESTYKRMRNPPKTYLVDTGLSRRVTSADCGRLLENVVYLELRRRGYEIYYFADKGECDFIASIEESSFQPVQVCFQLSEENLGREVGGLVQACKHLHVNEGILLAYDDERELERDDVKITVMPVWKWAGFPSAKP
jgi:predicted AAA+ superfamily ATPase